ncbi:deoxynucleotidyltransferase terminal-interacting protein 1-like [Sinocyclocheilus grahami]|uniref:deoxynucleotidyltransferase terminal-interacting protein 1-like n=1 Tax=Sinocyclocheilus grahami TaxID=75366 RepID=UPI0007AD3D59|nr:PREDICTED: deoxynucleotidyltransferase terminal-interacting protein 1-like [Sinocyclocheilus grahami]
MGAQRSEGRRDWLQQDFSEQQVQTANPWNIMIKHRQVHRRGRRSQMTVSYTDPVISMDLLRTVLQPSFNEDIRAVFRKYMKFFEKAASNVKENVGGDVQPDQLIRDACRSCLEHSEYNFRALGMGGTRGRIYIKHAELFKYAADAQDKHWLSERQHMRATGGKMAYLLIEEDILGLARSEDYKDCPDLKLDELKPFLVPLWMVEKMQKAMDAQKTENELVM